VIIAQVAPAVRVTIGEELGLPLGTSATGKLVTALRLLGFDYVFGEREKCHRAARSNRRSTPAAGGPRACVLLQTCWPAPT
jgi:hypothetical protein